MITWDNIDTVLLDMDGTLLDLHFDNFFWTEHVPRVYASSNELSEQQTRQHLHRLFGSRQGTLDWYSLDYWSDQLELDLAALKTELRHMIKIRPHTEQFLRSLSDSPMEVLLVTNAHRKTLDIKMDTVPLSQWFDKLVVSHELDAPKEEQAFWRSLQQLHPFDPKRTLLIDDTEKVLQAAQEFGIAHLLTLLQPDSTVQKRIDTQFRGIHHFDEIMEGIPQKG